MAKELENARQKNALPKKIVIEVENNTNRDFDLMKGHEKLLSIAPGTTKEMTLPVDKLEIHVDESGATCVYFVAYSSNLKFDSPKKNEKYALDITGSSRKAFDDVITSEFSAELFEKERSGSANSESKTEIEIDKEGVSFTGDAKNAEYHVKIDLYGDELEESSLTVTDLRVNVHE